MYIPEFNRIEDRAIAFAFMHANPFAILVSSGESGPFATHLPVLIDQSAGQLTLRAHVTNANPHWQMIGPDHESLVVFHGPHAYISPALYEIRESVPTWNYAAVHVYGKGRVISEESATRQVLDDLVNQFDSSYNQQWNSFSEE